MRRPLTSHILAVLLVVSAHETCCSAHVCTNDSWRIIKVTVDFNTKSPVDFINACQRDYYVQVFYCFMLSLKAINVSANVGLCMLKRHCHFLLGFFVRMNCGAFNISSQF